MLNPASFGSRSPFDRRRVIPSRIFSDLSEADTDLSFVSSGRPSTDRTSSMMYDGMDSGRISQISTSSDSSFGSERLGARGSELSSFNDFSSSSFETVSLLSLSGNVIDK